MSEITAKSLEKVLKMAAKLPASRFYSLVAVAALAAVAWVIRAVAELISAIH